MGINYLEYEKLMDDLSTFSYHFFETVCGVRVELFCVAYLCKGITTALADTIILCNVIADALEAPEISLLSPFGSGRTQPSFLLKIYFITSYQPTHHRITDMQIWVMTFSCEIWKYSYEVILMGNKLSAAPTKHGPPQEP